MSKKIGIIILILIILVSTANTVISYIPEDDNIVREPQNFEFSLDSNWANENINENTVEIIWYSPSDNPTTIEDENQEFSIELNSNADIEWYIDSILVQTESNKDVSSYSNNIAGPGIWNVTVVATGGNTVSYSWDWTVNEQQQLDTPPEPNLVSETGNFWVKYAWSPGEGVITDSYNVDINGTWDNQTTETSKNVSTIPHGLVNITIQAYNNSGMLSNPISQEIQIPNNPPVQNIGNQEVTEGNTLIFTIASDADNDVITFNTNATKGNLNQTTGKYSWSPNNSDIGNYIWHFTSSDDYGGIDNETITVTVKKKTSSGNSGGSSGSSGSGGGGGGGVNSGEPYLNILFSQRKEFSIYAGKTTSYSFTDDKNPISFVNITGNRNQDDIVTLVEILKGLSSLVKGPTPNITYKYVNIWVGSSFVNSRNVKSSSITFKVENSWMKKNYLKPRNINLMQWNGNEWTRLDVSEKNRDSNYTFYESTVKSLGHFAIIGSKEIISPRTNPEQTINANTTVPVATTGVPISDTTPEKTPSKKLSGFEMLIPVFALLTTYFIKKRI